MLAKHIDVSDATEVSSKKKRVSRAIFNQILVAFGKLPRALRWVIIIALLLQSIYILIFANHFLFTRYSITETQTITGVVYSHKDARTTGIIDYLTVNTMPPESERLPLFRQYVKNVREDAEMEIPENINELGWSELIELAREWYLKTSPEKPTDGNVPEGVINDLFTKAIQSPLKDFGPNVNDRVWRLMIDVGSPKIRWIEEKDEFASWFVAYSAGDKQSFYNPFNNTIYITYGDAVKKLNDEAGHAEQFNEYPLKSYPRMFYSLISSWVIAVFNLPTEAKRVYSTRYKDPETFEGEAHGPVKSALLEKYGLQIVDEEAPNKPDKSHECVIPSAIKK